MTVELQACRGVPVITAQVGRPARRLGLWTGGGAALLAVLRWIPIEHRPLLGPPRQDRHQREAQAAAQRPAAPIGLGRRYAGTPVLVLVHDRHIRVLSTSGQILRDSLSPDGTTNPRPQRERCPGTPVNGVWGHRSGAPGRIRTCAHRLRRPVDLVIADAFWRPTWAFCSRLVSLVTSCVLWFDPRDIPRRTSI